MFLWFCSGHGEIGCVTVITNLAKVRGKQIEPEKLESSDASSPQLPPALICSGNSPQTHWFHANDWISMHLLWDGGGQETTHLSTPRDWRADARSKWQVISALASFKWNLYAFLVICSSAVTAHLSCGPFHFQCRSELFLRYRPSSPHSDKHLWPFRWSALFI